MTDHPVLTGLPHELSERAALAFNTLRAGTDWEISPQVSVPALSKAALLLLVKDEADIISQNLQHHYQLGFRRFFILDNNSTDGTTDLIIQFRHDYPDARVFCAFDYQIAYYQASKMKALEQFMLLYLEHDETPVDWVFFVDADEFITCCTQNTEQAVEKFNAILEDPGISMLVFNWAQAALVSPAQKPVPFGPTLGETHLTVWPKMKVNVTKIAYRLRQGLSPVTGNHFVERFDQPASAIRIMTEAEFCMLHFPMRSKEQIRKKIENGMTALKASTLPDYVGEHWRTYYSWYKQGGDNVLLGLLRDHIRSCIRP
nr:glycosyltransferase family 2 protein [uncultured Acetobacter sp.]